MSAALLTDCCVACGSAVGQAVDTVIRRDLTDVPLFDWVAVVPFVGFDGDTVRLDLSDREAGWAQLSLTPAQAVQLAHLLLDRATYVAPHLTRAARWTGK